MNITQLVGGSAKVAVGQKVMSIFRLELLGNMDEFDAPSAFDKKLKIYGDEYRRRHPKRP